MLQHGLLPWTTGPPLLGFAGSEVGGPGETALLPDSTAERRPEVRLGGRELPPKRTSLSLAQQPACGEHGLLLLPLAFARDDKESQVVGFQVEQGHAERVGSVESPGVDAPGWTRHVRRKMGVAGK